MCRFELKRRNAHVISLSKSSKLVKENTHSARPRSCACCASTEIVLSSASVEDGNICTIFYLKLTHAEVSLAIPFCVYCLPLTALEPPLSPF